MNRYPDLADTENFGFLINLEISLQERKMSREDFLKRLRKLAIEFYDQHHANSTDETLPVESTNTTSTNDLNASRKSLSSSDSQKVA